MITIKIPRLNSFFLRHITNPNHHLWLNRNVWNIHYTEKTVFDPIFKRKAKRIRKSLHTKDLHIARQRRDEYIKEHNIL
jgi:hypothetical protein